jgi:hypothetical protein
MERLAEAGFDPAPLVRVPFDHMVRGLSALDVRCR